MVLWLAESTFASATAQVCTSEEVWVGLEPVCQILGLHLVDDVLSPDSGGHVVFTAEETFIESVLLKQIETECLRELSVFISAVF